MRANLSREGFQSHNPLLWVELCLPKIYMLKSLPQKGTLFGNRVIADIISENEVILESGGFLTRGDCYPCKQVKFAHKLSQGKGHVRRRGEKMVIHKPRTEIWTRPSLTTTSRYNPATTLTWVSSLQDCETTHFCCSSRPVYGTLFQQTQ